MRFRTEESVNGEPAGQVAVEQEEDVVVLTVSSFFDLWENPEESSELVLLTPSEARSLAVALLTLAEDAEREANA